MLQELHPLTTQAEQRIRQRIRQRHPLYYYGFWLMGRLAWLGIVSGSVLLFGSLIFGVMYSLQDWDPSPQHVEFMLALSVWPWMMGAVAFLIRQAIAEKLRAIVLEAVSDRPR
ncbi:hypothetical protein QR66_18130 [Chromobacterium piscinae]|nr:hypothetical protein QR66_18130 [Chromobacterium piscinae]